MRISNLFCRRTGVVAHSEVGLALLALGWLGLLEVGVLAEMLIIKLRSESGVRSFGHDALLVEHRDDTERLKGA